MNNHQPNITAAKQQEVEAVKTALLKYDGVCIFDLSQLPSKQLQFLRHKLRDKIQIEVRKKRFIKLAIQQVQQQRDFSSLLPYLEQGIPALIFTNDDPFKVYNVIKQSKSAAPAKAGQLAPKDLVIEPGPTSFPPGPIIGELGQAGIIAAVEQGKVVIKKETVIAKKGDIITQKKADVLMKLGIQPMEVGMKILVAYQSGILYPQDILDVDEETYLQNLKAAALSAFHLTLAIVYITPENISQLIRKAYDLTGFLAEKHSILTSETIKKELKKAELGALKIKDKVPEPESLPEDIPQHHTHPAEQHQAQPAATSQVYSKTDEAVAQQLLESLKERDIQEKEKKSKPGLWSSADLNVPSAHDLAEEKKKQKKHD